MNSGGVLVLSPAAFIVCPPRPDPKRIVLVLAGAHVAHMRAEKEAKGQEQVEVGHERMKLV